MTINTKRDEGIWKEVLRGKYTMTAIGLVHGISRSRVQAIFQQQDRRWRQRLEKNLNYIQHMMGDGTRKTNLMVYRKSEEYEYRHGRIAWMNSV